MVRMCLKAHELACSPADERISGRSSSANSPTRLASARSCTTDSTRLLPRSQPCITTTPCYAKNSTSAATVWTAPPHHPFASADPMTCVATNTTISCGRSERRHANRPFQRERHHHCEPWRGQVVSFGTDAISPSATCPHAEISSAQAEKPYPERIRQSVRTAGIGGGCGDGSAAGVPVVWRGAP
jgi:hypothetical protein